VSITGSTYRYIQSIFGQCPSLCGTCHYAASVTLIVVRHLSLCIVYYCMGQLHSIHHCIVSIVTRHPSLHGTQSHVASIRYAKPIIIWSLSLRGVYPYTKFEVYPYGVPIIAQRLSLYRDYLEQFKIAELFHRSRGQQI
jgi:hypothetical protein